MGLGNEEALNDLACEKGLEPRATYILVKKEVVFVVQVCGPLTLKQEENKSKKYVCEKGLQARATCVLVKKEGFWMCALFLIKISRGSEGSTTAQKKSYQVTDCYFNE